jgi:RNA polymerase sigma-70 factor (ECF subfamily)
MFRHWLFTTTLRKLVEKERYHTAAKRNPGRIAAKGDPDRSHADLLRAIAGNAATPSHIAAGRESLARIEAALRDLPEDHREIILMSRLMGLSHAEIAEHLDRTESAVRTTLCRALAKLAHLLSE